MTVLAVTSQQKLIYQLAHHAPSTVPYSMVLVQQSSKAKILLLLKQKSLIDCYYIIKYKSRHCFCCNSRMIFNSFILIILVLFSIEREMVLIKQNFQVVLVKRIVVFYQLLISQ